MPSRTPAELDGRIGEGFAGTAPNASHVNLVVGARGSATAAAISAALGQVAPGHAPFLACLGPGAAVRPATVVRNKSTLLTARQERMTWGAMQLGVAEGVMEAVATGVVAREHVDELVLLVSVWVDPDADDELAVREANAAACLDAVRDATEPSDVDALLARRSTADNVFFRGAGAPDA